MGPFRKRMFLLGSSINDAIQILTIFDTSLRPIVTFFITKIICTVVTKSLTPSRDVIESGSFIDGSLDANFGILQEFGISKNYGLCLKPK